MWKIRAIAIALLLAGTAVGYFVYASEVDSESRFPFKLGLDLAGGTHLVYRADTTNLPQEDIEESMRALRDVIERRVNLFGVAEPVVQTERNSVVSDTREYRLIVELPGVTNTEDAIAQIGKTPVLEFKLRAEDAPVATTTPATGAAADTFRDTGLTGRFVEGAALEFGSGQSAGVSNEPVVVVQFNSEGAALFEEITSENVGRVIGIFLDGQLIEAPIVREAIPGGEAVISGSFTPDAARELVRNLNFGALPVPIELRSVQTIGATLGSETLNAGVLAGVWGLALVAAFMLAWYRLPGLVAVGALSIYVALMLALFKVIPVTLTAAGLAGFILSIGMAVDANVLIFERIKEELREREDMRDAVRTGFARAWLSIRDGNLSSLITAIILFWFGTSLVEGFALVFGLGILVSMLSAITITRTILLLVVARDRITNGGRIGRLQRMLFGSGITK